MTTHFLQRAGRVSLAIGVVGVATAVVLAWIQHRGFAPAYRFAGIACLEPAVGSMIFLLIYKTTGGEWAKPLLPFLSAGVRMLPWCWLAMLPLLWLDPNPARALAADQGPLKYYLSHEAMIIRAIIYTALFFALRWTVQPFLTKLVVVPDKLSQADGGRRDHLEKAAEAVVVISIQPRTVRPWAGPVGLIVLTFAMHLLATDWLLATEPDWSSTGFPLVWLGGQAVAGLALAVASAVAVGTDPARRLKNGAALGVDWGNLLLATIVFWVYVAFVQLLIIWSGNLPRETTWYLHRWHGPWRALLVGVVLLHFVIPFFLLLSKKIKRRPRGLLGVATLVALAQTAYVSWMILPSYHLSGFSEYALIFAVLLGAGGVFVNRYLANVNINSVVAPIVG